MPSQKNAFIKFAETLSKLDEDPQSRHTIELDLDGKKILLILEISQRKKSLALVENKDEEESA